MARNFPEEVITEILSWVPVKSLMRFKCVSKPWLHLISNDPRFMKLHFNHSFLTKNSTPGILVSRKEGVEKTEFYYAEEYTAFNKLARIEIPFSNPIYSSSIILGVCSDFMVFSICNGLVCFTDTYRGDNTYVYIWNPLTRDHIIIPCSPIPYSFRTELGNGNLDPYTSITFGFGYDQANDEYKVIRYVSSSPFESYELHSHVTVYTLGEGSSWRTLEQFVPYDISSSHNLFNGSLHWFGCKLHGWVHPYVHDILIAFDMQHETFQEIPQPDGITHGYPFSVSVGELGGLFSMFCGHQHEYVEIWVMEEYGVADSWTKLWKIVHPDDSPYYLTPLRVADNGEIIISKNTWEWILYDPNTNSVRDLHRFEFQVFDSNIFKASLLPPTILNGASRPGLTVD